jgi:RND family efflux transporter MFP subunit
MIRPGSVLVPAVAMAAATLAACGHDASTVKPADLPAVSVRVQAVEKVTEGRTVEVRGTVQASRRAQVSSRVSGPVVRLRVQAGDEVQAGAPMLEIQPESSQGQLDQARGSLAQAEAASTLAERNLERYQALYDERAASELELDMARTQAEQARGAVEQARGAVLGATSIASEALVRAPFAARVVRTLVEVGDLATPGRPLVEVESARGRQLQVALRAGEISRVQIGDPVPVSLDARPDLGALQGAVSEIVPSADPATHTFTVKIDLPGADVASGLAGRAQIPGGSSERLLVPVSAIHRRGGLELAIVRAADGAARIRAVTTGARRSDGRVEMLSGLAEGEMVVIDAAAPPIDGTPLEVAR